MNSAECRRNTQKHTKNYEVLSIAVHLPLFKKNKKKVLVLTWKL